MTAKNPPLYVQAGSYTSEDDRLLPSALVAGRGGVVLAPDLAVTQNGTPNMSVNVAGGKVIIPGTEATYQGVYVCENRGVTNLAITAANATNPRYDLIIAKVQDASYSGATNLWSIDKVTGTAAASPVEPTLPPNSIQLARITVAAAATTITTANILDRRMSTTKGQATALGGTVVTTSGNRPTTNVYEGLTILETDTDRRLTWNGTAWVSAGGYEQIAPSFYSMALLNGTSTAYAVWYGSGVLITAPYPLTMVARVYLQVGFASTSHLAWFFVSDLTGATITQGIGGPGSTPGEPGVNVDSGWHDLSFVGKRDYATGDSVGFGMVYKVDSGNVYASGAVEINYYPKVS